LREAAVFVSWLIEQTTIVRGRAERRRDRLARLIELGSEISVIRPSGDTSGKSDRRARYDYRLHFLRTWDQPSTTSSGRQRKHPPGSLVFAAGRPF